MIHTMNLDEGIVNDQDVQAELVVLCSIGPNHLGVPALLVQEILRPPAIRKVHHASPFVLGVFNLRGQIVELLDPAKKLGLEEEPLPADARIMVLERGETIVGILVHSVTGVFPYDPGAIKPIPENLPVNQREVIAGFLKIDEKVVALLHVEALLKPLSEAIPVSTERME